MPLLTISAIAELARDSEDNIQQFIRKDRIPYAVFPDGILILFGGFQACMPNLYDLTSDLEALNAAAKAIDPADQDKLYQDHRDE